MRKKKSIFNKKISRREFIKKSVIALGGLYIGYQGFNKLLLTNLFSNNDNGLGKWSKEAYHYNKLGVAVQCTLCPHECVLSRGERGFCGVRKNYNNKLYTLVYGNPCAVHVDPIEKKPLFHFLPATKAFSIATAGCNFRCLNCQNWEISQSKPEETDNIDLMPEAVVANAILQDCKTIAYTYSEPSVFYEYMYDTSKYAHSKGLKNLFITNGYMNEKPLREFCQHLDAANVDLKGFDKKVLLKLTGGDFDNVLKTLKILKEENVWFEITNLIVPTYTDDLDKIKEMCVWIVDNLGRDVPLHFSRFMPQYKLLYLPPTPVSTLEKAKKIALGAGIKYVYIGNVPGHEANNTYCVNGHLCIERQGYVITQNNVVDGKCRECGESIAGVWK
ncbi:AmmeMemoRadiSam system radical SAM enzyme [Candidatus Woesearchaeota archaeon]|nr:AmmeMemoRadiSam system radical SAM enzyme [Candidatus Woesearchaeota archaeon]